MRPLGGGGRALLVNLAIAGVLGCGREPRPARPPDLILVSIDTLRADRLGCYGSPRPTSPAIDRFRAGAVLFRTAIAQAPSTLASHATMLTSLPPRAHGASYARRRRLPDEVVTLAEALRTAGYRTAAITAAGQMRREFGLRQGFDVYRARPERLRPGAFDRRIDLALSLLEEGDGRPVFLFLHTYEVHHPYTPDPDLLAELDPGYRGRLGDRVSIELLNRINGGEIDLDAADRRHVARAYEAEIRSVDRAFGRLVAALDAHPRWRDAVVVLTSDHGEELGEHGSLGWHGDKLYDEQLRVPLLLRLPRGERRGGEVATPVRLIDLAPTLLDLAGVAAPPAFRGRSLLPLVRGESHRELPALATLDDETGTSHALRFAGWKLYGGRLFDLARDPGERLDCAAARPERRRELERMLQAALAGRAAPGRAAELDVDAERELRALGYL